MEQKKNKKKIIATSLIALASIGIITVGTLALFTDYADADDEGIAGRLDINIHDFAITNKDNINPGDNDPLAPKTYIPLSGDPLYDPSNPNAEVPISTTDHIISYTISNDGNQSARVRRSFYISCITPSNEILDPSNFFIYEGDKELVDKYLVDSNNNEYLVAAADPVAHPIDTIPEGAEIVAVKYIENADIYDGVGKGAQIEKESTVKAEDGKCAKAFEYHLGMTNDSPNIYQGVYVEVEIVVEALQFRNTTDTKWVETSRKSLTATTSGLVFDIVPNASRDVNVETSIAVSDPPVDGIQDSEQSEQSTVSEQPTKTPDQSSESTTETTASVTEPTPDESITNTQEG